MGYSAAHHRKAPGIPFRPVVAFLFLALCLTGKNLSAGIDDERVPGDDLETAIRQPAATDVTGSVFGYKVQKGDSLTLLSARFGTAIRNLAELNGLSPTVFLREGQTLQIDNRHLVPATLEDGILVNIPQRMLFIFKAGRLAGAYPVTVGKADWQTPIGLFHVLEKQHDKTWNVPLSIQEEMRREGLVVRQEVPPGPDNPLGEYWIRISPSCGIHGTNAPASIYSATSHGCLRLQPSVIAEIYALSVVGMPVQVIYQPLLFAKIGDACYIEANRDVYGMNPPRIAAIEAWATEAGVKQAIDWQLVRNELQATRGIARPVCSANASWNNGKSSPQ
jgi:L,D-transpeptidase ErfK/SrfK